MANCCPPILYNILNEAISTIPYGDYERSLYGSKPRVEIIYFINNEWVNGGVFTDVRYNADTITIDHGGSSEIGYVKVW